MKRIIILATIVLAVIALLVTTGLAKKESSARGWLGVYTQSVNYDLAEAFDLDVQYGAVINEVVEDSPADDAGLREGDVIVSLNKEKITDSDDLNDVMAETQAGDQIEIVINRDGTEQNFTLTAGEAPKDEHTWFHYGSGDPNVWVFPSRPVTYVGIQLMDLNEQLGEYFGITDGEGVLIVEVDEESPAAKAGLKAGDVIVEVDGKKVESASEITAQMEEHESGEQVNYSVVRDRRTSQFTVEVEERKGSSFGHGYMFGPDRAVINVPKLRGLFNSNFPNSFEAEFGEEFEQEMAQLAEELAKLKLELKDADGIGGGRDELRRDMEELRRELRDLKRELQKELKEMNERLQ